MSPETFEAFAICDEPDQWAAATATSTDAA